MQRQDDPVNQILLAMQQRAEIQKVIEEKGKAAFVSRKPKYKSKMGRRIARNRRG